MLSFSRLLKTKGNLQTIIKFFQRNPKHREQSSQFVFDENEMQLHNQLFEDNLSDPILSENMLGFEREMLATQMKFLNHKQNQEEIIIPSEKQSKVGDPIKFINSFRNSTLSEEVKHIKAQQFMQNLAHFFESDQAKQIIEEIQSYVQQKQSKNSSFLSKPKVSQKKLQQQLFKNIKKRFFYDFVHTGRSQSENIIIIQELIRLLSQSNPSQINMKIFKIKNFTMEVMSDVFEPQKQKGLLMSELKIKSKSTKYQITPNNVKENDFDKKYKDLKSMFTSDNSKNRSRKAEPKKMNLQQQMVSRVKVASQKAIIFTQKNKSFKFLNEDKLKESNKYIYIYQLPYILTEQLAQQIKFELNLQYNINISDYYLFSYQNYMSKNWNHVIYNTPDRYETNKYNTSHMEKIYQQQVPVVYQYNKQAKGRKNKYSKPKNKLSSSESMLENLKNQCKNKFNKSSIIAKLQTLEQKNNLVTNEARLFGLNICGLKNVKIEEGVGKTILRIDNIPWGCSSKQLQNHINERLSCRNVIVDYEECILTKSYAFIKFDYFNDALNSLSLINNTQFLENKLKVQFNYGSCQHFNGKFRETLDPDHYQKLKIKLQESNSFYTQLYQNMDYPFD